MRNLTSVLLLMLVAASSLAQPYGDSDFKKKFNKADALVFDGSFLEALPLLQDLYKYDTLNANLNHLLGICYLRGEKNHAKAIKLLESASRDVAPPDMYQEASWKERKAPGITYYYLGKAYHYKNRFDRAVKNYYNYRSFISLDDVERYNQVRQQIQYAENAMELIKNPVGVKVTNLGPEVNTIHPEYCPVVSADGKVLIFTSRRPGGKTAAVDDDGRHYEDIYQCNRLPDGKWSKPELLGSSINSAAHEAAIGLSPDGQMLFVYKDDKGDGNIYQSKRTSDGWSALEPVGSDVNTDAWETHASVTATQDLLVFTSNRSEGGHGGRDLWYCKKLPTGEWGLAMNMGSVINTNFEEDSPFISADGKTLIFSSQGHTSMGDFDIFKSEFVDGAWTTPENIGYPINTAEADVFFVLNPDGKTAYYSSRMDGGYGDTDLYKLRLEVKQAGALAVARGNMKVPAKAYADIDAKILVTDEGGANVGTYRPNPSTGYYVLVLDPGETYSMSYEADGYEPIVKQLPVDDSESYEEYDGVLELEDVVFGENILALQEETKRLEQEKAEAAARAAEQEALAAEATQRAKEEQEALALAAEKDAERKKAEELAAKEKENAEKALAAEEAKARQAEIERKKAEAQAKFKAKQEAAMKAAEDEAAAEEAKLKQEAELVAQNTVAEEAVRKKAEEETQAQQQAEAAAAEKAEEEAAAEAALAETQAKIEEAKKAVEAAKEEEATRQEAQLAAAEEKARLAREEEARQAEEVRKQQETELAEKQAKIEAAKQAALAAEKEAAARKEAEALEASKKAEQELANAKELSDEQAKREEAARQKQLELQQRIQALKAQRQQQEVEIAEVKEVQVQKMDEVKQETSVNASAIEAKREAMLARIEELKKRKAEVEKNKVVDEAAVVKATEKEKEALNKKQELVQKSEQTQEEIEELQKELEVVEKQVEEAEVLVQKAQTEVAQAAEKLAEDIAEEKRIAEEERKKKEEAEEAARQLKELQEQERKRLEQERLAAEQFEKEQREEAERTKRELIQLEALAEQQAQVEAALAAEERKKKLIEQAEGEAYSQEDVLANASTLDQLRKLNRQLIQDNLELKKQLAELNAKLDLILQRLDYQPDIEKVDMPSSNTMRNLQEGRRLILRNIFFDYNQATLRSRSKHELNKLFEFMKSYPNVSIEVSGHTDSRGNDDYNLRLSKDRAQAVVDYLVRNGISSSRLKAIGYGETRPIARNENADLTDNPVGRQLNRRIEISLPKGEVDGVEVEEIQVPAGAKIK